MHFIVFHYVIVCFIAFHLFSLAVGGGMAQEHHFSGDDVLQAEWHHNTPAPQCQCPSLPSLPTGKNQVPNKAEVFSALR